MAVACLERMTRANLRQRLRFREVRGGQAPSDLRRYLAALTAWLDFKILLT